MYRWGLNSAEHLAEAHPDLIEVCYRALELAYWNNLPDMGISDCGRDAHEQRKMVEAGVSWTMNSRHRFAWPLSDKGNRLRRFRTSVSHAVDFFIVIEGRAQWARELYIAQWNGAWKPAASELGIEIRSGGRWKRQDWPHVELYRKAYPAELDEIA